MKKWLDDLYAILLKHGFNTLDNVLKNVNEYKEIKINDVSITLNSNETYSIDFTNYFNQYDRFILYNRGKDDAYNFMYSFYKYSDANLYMYSGINNFTNKYTVGVSSNRKVVNITNVSDSSIEFDFYVKKLC